MSAACSQRNARGTRCKRTATAGGLCAAHARREVARLVGEIARDLARFDEPDPPQARASFRVGSVCSGIAADALAVRAAGLPWEHAFFSEIAPFPSRVLAHHYPEVPNHGDFTTIAAEAAADLALLVGGTPCQSFSVAGLRGGMDDHRGNLALEFVRLAARARPRWIVWENVPGVLTSGNGRDLGSFLGALAALGYGFAYRVLDARWFGLAQRRRRVFVVGYLGDWRRAAAVLAESPRVLGDPPARGSTRAGAAAGVEGGARGVVSALTVSRGGADDNDAQAGHIVAHTLRGAGFDASEDGTGRGTPLVVAKTLLAASPRIDAETETFVAYQCHGSNAGPMGTLRKGNGHLTGGVPFVTHTARAVQEDNQNGVLVSDKAGTLRANAPGTTAVGTLVFVSPVAAPLTTTPHADNESQESKLVAYYEAALDDVGFCASRREREVIAFDETQITSPENRSRGLPGEPSPSLAKGARPPTIAFNIYPASGQGADLEATTTTTIASGINVTALSASTERGTRIVGPQAGVRRLTPTECERLMGTPDGYTAIPDAADGPRYAALGNSIAVPVLAWIFKRIAFVDSIPKETT